MHKKAGDYLKERSKFHLLNNMNFYDTFVYSGGKLMESFHLGQVSYVDVNVIIVLLHSYQLQIYEVIY